MKEKKVWSTVLIVVGALCLLLAVVVFGKRFLDDRALEKQMESLQAAGNAEGTVPAEETKELGVAGGTAGTTEANGTPGTNESDGPNGTTGTNGSDGPNGTTGTNESDGPNGTPGTNGSEGPNGTMGTNESDGSEGSEEKNSDKPDPAGAGNSQEGSQESDASENGASGNGTPGNAAQEGGTEGDETPENAAPVLVQNPYADAYRQNEDMVGWLKIEGTVIDYPVMQTMEDENYYLNRGFDKKKNQNGCLILDTDSAATGDISTNLIIHGHNMKSGAMFGDLEKYENAEYCEKHKYITLYTKECQHNYEVIAVFRSQVFKKTDNVFKYYKFFQADTQEEFDDWYDNIMALAQFDTGVTAQFGDCFLTLSTCVYHVTNGRLVVVAKEIEPGDSYEPLVEDVVG